MLYNNLCCQTIKPASKSEMKHLHQDRVVQAENLITHLSKYETWGKLSYFQISPEGFRVEVVCLQVFRRTVWRHACFGEHFHYKK